jgi:O-antigen ligase
VPEPAQEGALFDRLGPAVLWLFVVAYGAPFEHLVRTPGGPISAVFSVLAVSALLLAPPDRLGRAPVLLAAWGLLGWLGLSYLWSVNPSFTLYLIRFELIPLVLLALVVGAMRPAQVIRTLVAIFVVLGLWSLAVSVVLPSARSVTRGDLVQQIGIRGTFDHKNLLGVFLVVGLCVLVPFLRGPRRPVILALFIVGILATRSATVAGGLLAVAFVWFWRSAIEQQRTRRQRQALAAMSVGSAIAAPLVILGLLPTILGLYDKDITFSGRTHVWSQSFDLISAQPLHGYGWGGVWSDPTSALTTELHRHIGFAAAHAHNAWVELLLSGGAVAFALGVLVFAQALYVSVRCLRRPDAVRYGEWGLMTVVALLFMGLAEPLLQGLYLGMLLVVWVVLVRVLRARPAGDQSLRSTTAVAVAGRTR